MTAQLKKQGFLASNEGLKNLQSKMNELNLSFEEIATKAGLESEDQVIQLFKPSLNQRLQKDTIDKVARVLDLKTADIIEQRKRGYFASEEGLKNLRSKKDELKLSYEEIASKAGLGSEDQVKRLFYPRLKRKVQMDTVERIAGVLNLDTTDIIEEETQEQPEVTSKSTSVVLQKALCDTEVTEDLEAEDISQKANGGGSVVQMIGYNSKAKSIKIRNVTQEAQCFERLSQTKPRQSKHI
jgi:transcriptional regulator with XRE-family HTH domain